MPARPERPGQRLPPRPLAVAVGGLAGSWARWGISSAAPVAPGTFPVTTLAVNVAGSALLGVVLVVLLDRRPAHLRLHALLGTGFLGAFTTFSTFAVEVVELGRHDHLPVAVAYLVVSLGGGVAAVLAGLALARRTLGPPVGR